MQFRLVYDGELPAEGKSLVLTKHRIRQYIHPQLKDLWQRHQALRWLKQTINEAKESQAKEGHSVSDYFLSYLKIAHKIGPYEMWPLISDHLKLLCHLDILFLRNENPGVSS